MNEGTPLGVKSTISHKASVLNKAPQRNFTFTFTFSQNDGGTKSIFVLMSEGQNDMERVILTEGLMSMEVIKSR
jgi:hypothetical protein